MHLPDLTDVRALRGPNVWSRCAVLQASFCPPCLPSGAVLDSPEFANRFTHLTSPLGSLAGPVLTAAEEWSTTGDGSHLALAIARLSLAIEIAATSQVSFC